MAEWDQSGPGFRAVIRGPLRETLEEAQKDQHHFDRQLAGVNLLLQVDTELQEIRKEIAAGTPTVACRGLTRLAETEQAKRARDKEMNHD